MDVSRVSFVFHFTLASASLHLEEVNYCYCYYCYYYYCPCSFFQETAETIILEWLIPRI